MSCQIRGISQPKCDTHGDSVVMRCSFDGCSHSETISNLRQMLDDANGREQSLIKKLDAVLRISLENLEGPPRPMCKPDPLEDIMPPVGEEGRPT